MTDAGPAGEQSDLSLRGHVKRAAGVALVALAFLMLDPLGFGEATNRHSNEVFGRIMAPFYDQDNQDRDTEKRRRCAEADGKGKDCEVIRSAENSAQNRIVIILYDDAYLESMEMAGGGRWPLPVGIHTRLLIKLAQYKPKVIFFDLLFRFERDQGPALETFAGKINEFQGPDVEGEEIDILLATTSKTPDAASPADAAAPPVLSLVPQLQESEAQMVGVNWHGTDNAYPLSTGGVGSPLETPAAKMFRIFCRNQRHAEKNRPEICDEIGMTPLQDHRLFAKNLVVRWSSRANTGYRDMSKEYDKDCLLYGRDGSARWLETGRQALIALGAGIAQGVGVHGMQRCTYHLTLQPDIFFDYARNEEVAKIIEGSYVLIGADVSGAQDIVNSPIHGQLPAVNLHAMALDNLMTYGERYYRNAPRFPWIKGDTIIEALSLFIVFLAASVLRANYTRLCQQRQHGPAGGQAAIETAAGASAPRHGQGEITALILRLPNLILARIRFRRRQHRPRSFSCRHPLLWAWLMYLAIALIPITITWVMNWKFRWPPANWIGVLLLSVFAIQFIFKDTKHEVLWYSQQKIRQIKDRFRHQ